MLSLRFSDHLYETGTDEAGRGCLAGPVTAAAVILPEDFQHEFLNDSKQLTEKMREHLRPIIMEKALCYHLTNIEPEIIDEINILNASIRAMQECIVKLTPEPQYIIVDGNRFKPVNNIPYSCIIQGDAKYMSIAAASILAKTHRDDYMNKIHEEYPMYNWKSNKGYPTPEHREAIRKYGITKYHRKSFRLLPDQLELEFDIVDDVHLRIVNP
ncbi:ribonuclease HII [Flavobacterium cyanobacteriorum]|uniref:Ribonuclease HII n=1 Tax=Flavobacterium cyanobacteriorum TaxID=2022802 RepID=A0A255Z9L0_9FLAO|nr:ribonuclease HII [Flavobacterium cyanobacteriorum]OYQ38253.1 ribonuclease HII [Flavobacterium cyanobacteriorum]